MDGALNEEPQQRRVEFIAVKRDKLFIRRTNVFDPELSLTVRQMRQRRRNHCRSCKKVGGRLTSDAELAERVALMLTVVDVVQLRQSVSVTEARPTVTLSHSLAHSPLLADPLLRLFPPRSCSISAPAPPDTLFAVRLAYVLCAKLIHLRAPYAVACQRSIVSIKNGRSTSRRYALLNWLAQRILC